MRSIADTLDYMENLVKAGVDIFDVDLGCYDNWWLPHPPAGMPAGCFLDISKVAKEYFAARDPNNYPGTGDIFSSIVLSYVLTGREIFDGIKTACDYISAVSRRTTALGLPVREGLAIEGTLQYLK